MLSFLAGLSLKDFIFMIGGIMILFFVIGVFGVNIGITLKYITFEIANLKNMLLTDFYYSHLMLMLLIIILLIVNFVKALKIFK